MSDFTTNWTPQELNAYLLLYCANADFNTTSEEVEMIRAKVDKEHYNAIHKEFEGDNDYQSIQKIGAAMKRLELDTNDTNALVAEMKTLFNADGHFDAAEKALFHGLKKILE